jgi:tryptophan synthase alpha chain
VRISEAFQESVKHRNGALIAYITGGDPSPKYTSRIVEAIVEGGADIVEIGVPFSDPIADGPVIQAANNRSIKAGTTPNTILDIVKETKKKVDVPIALLTYYNILFKRGVKRFLKEAGRHGVDGIIIPDLPIEEAEEYRGMAEKLGLNTIFLATPSTSKYRLKDILGFTSGFLYLISVFGVTGMRGQLTQLTTQTIMRLKQYTAKIVPLAVGFGISRPEHVSSVLSCGADGAIVGSAFVKIVESNLSSPHRLLEHVKVFTQKLRSAT